MSQSLLIAHHSQMSSSLATAGSKGSARTQESIYIPSDNPFLPLMWNGTCDAGQLTGGGFADSFHHGSYFWSVYGPDGNNPLLDHVSEHEILVRTSPEERTLQVAGGLLRGMGYANEKPFKVHTSPATIDGIVPSYSCSHANDLRTQINAEPEWTSHLQSKADLFTSVNEVLGTADDSGWNSWIDHAFDFLSSRQCHGHPLPTNPGNGKSISQSIADQVYEEGNWEYNYIWNASPNADEYVKYSFGVFVKELATRLRDIKTGRDTKHKLTAFIGHDGTMVRLLKTLAQPTLQWPGMGSEVIFEVYKVKSGKMYIRILSNGKTLHSTAKQLTSEERAAEVTWVSLDILVNYLEERVPSDLFEKCTA